MALNTIKVSGKFGLAILIGQFALSAIGLATVAFAPRGEAPALLVPILDSGAAELPAILSNRGTLLLARGQFDNSYIIRGVRPDFLEALLVHGVLVLNASAPGCGPENAEGAQ